MKLRQFRGPFRIGENPIQISQDIDQTYVHIAVQVPSKRPPISRWIPSELKNGTGKWDGKRIEPDININGKPYYINEYGILEFDGLAVKEWYIQFLKNLPPETIIDIIYKNKDE